MTFWGKVNFAIVAQTTVHKHTVILNWYQWQLVLFLGVGLGPLSEILPV